MDTEKDQHPAKRLKLVDSGSHETVIDEAKIQKPVAVLAEKYTRQVETVPVYVADLQNLKATSKCIRDLREKYPLEDLQHLKRVRRKKCKENGEVLQIILTKASNDTNVNKSEIVLPPEISKELGQPYIIHVPKDLPWTRKQFNEASKLWPTNFHEDKYIAKMISGEVFSDDDVKEINKYMSLAVNAAQYGKSQGMIPIGAAIVDPAKGNVIAIAHDLRRQGNPLQHAIMAVIDLVAQDQSGGAWVLGYQQDNGTWVLPDSTTKQPTMDTNSDQTSGTAVLGDNVEKIEKVTKTDKTGPYLCTGYDLYVTREPCVMCAMALVHSRIRRVFYGCEDRIIGALGSKYSLHVQHGLNHHYEVFTGVLREQCQQLITFSD